MATRVTHGLIATRTFSSRVRPIAVALVVFLLAAFTTLGLSAPPAYAFFDALFEELEISVGQSVHQQLVREHGVVNLPRPQQAFLERIMNDLTAVSDRPDLTYHITVLNAQEINAFAAPGGYLYVTLPFLRFVESTEELAGVLGHEVAHVARRHGMNTLQRELGTALILQLLFGRNDDRTLQTVVGIVMARIRSGWSQEQEFEADHYGARYAAAAGYGVEGLLTFLRRMESLQGGGDDLLTRWFSTHPPTGDRIARLEGLARELTVQARSEPIPPLPAAWRRR